MIGLQKQRRVSQWCIRFLSQLIWIMARKPELDIQAIFVLRAGTAGVGGAATQPGDGSISTCKAGKDPALWPGPDYTWLQSTKEVTRWDCGKAVNWNICPQISMLSSQKSERQCANSKLCLGLMHGVQWKLILITSPATEWAFAAVAPKFDNAC